MYHRTCLVKYTLESLTNGSRMPLRCCGAEPDRDDKCLDQMTPELLRELLTEQVFKKALKLSFQWYMHTNFDKIRFCPYPDCTGVYRPNAQSKIHVCAVCLNPICTSCHVPYHTRQKCAEHQETLQQYESPDVLNARHKLRMSVALWESNAGLARNSLAGCAIW